MSDPLSGDRFCSVCGGTPAFNIRHCGKCETVQCSRDVCRDVQTLLCAGEHVHDGTFCHQCQGDLSDVACPADEPYGIDWEPHVIGGPG